MLQARTRQALAPVDSRGRVDPAVLDQSFVALAPVLMPDLQRAEICDLRHPTTCSGFRGELPSEATARLRGKFIAGFYGKGMGLITRAEFRRRFGAEGGDDELCRVFAIVEPRDLDWSDEGAVNNVVITVGTGIVTDGGSLVASDPTGEMSPDRRAQVRAQVLMAGRRLWREGYPPDIIAFRIPPSD